MPMSTPGSDTERAVIARRPRLRLLPERWLRPWREAGRFARTVVWVGAGITAIFVFIAIFAPFIWHYSGTAYQGIPKLAPPSGKHPFGTTSINFDVLARALGAKRRTIVWRYIFFNVVQSIPVIFSLNAADAIITLAALGFLGYGVNPPTPEWGQDLSRAIHDLASGVWWTALFPGLAI